MSPEMKARLLICHSWGQMRPGTAERYGFDQFDEEALGDLAALADIDAEGAARVALTMLEEIR